MSRVEQIEHAIEELSPEEFAVIARWFQEKDQQRWDEQLDADSASGKLDFLFEETSDTLPWPPKS